MLVLDAIAEQRIAEAVAKGDFDGLPGAGQPLELEEDLLVPEELRMAYRILKNAGFVPPEVHTLKEIRELERLVESMEEGEPRSLAQRKLHLLAMQLGESSSLRMEAAYYDRVIRRLAWGLPSGP